MARRGDKSALPLAGELGDELGLTRLVQTHLEWMATKGYTAQTIEGRTKELRPFLLWCSVHNLARPGEITRPMLERYQRHLFHYRKSDGKPLSFVAQRGRLYAVRSFYRWLARNNLVLSNPASELELPKVPRRLPRCILTASEIEAVLAQPDLTDILGVRDRALLETLYTTGMRRAEVCGLEVFGLERERGTVMIRQGKGQKDRVVPLGPRALAWIEKYLAEVRPKLVVEPDEGVLFLSHLGTALDKGYLTHRVRRYIERAELGKRGSCHAFRHSMATLMLENGADIRFIQAMLGHAELSTTKIYTQVSIRALAEVHAATHPSCLSHKAAREKRSVRAGESRAQAGDGGEQPGASGLEATRDELLSSLAAEEAEEAGQTATAADDCVADDVAH